MEDLKPAIEYSTYEEYCAPRLQLKMGVMPESLFDLIHRSEIAAELDQSFEYNFDHLVEAS